MMLADNATIADGIHHESGDTRVIRNKEQVLNIIQHVYENPFFSDNNHLLKIVTGEHGQPAVQNDLTHIKDIGQRAVNETIIIVQQKKVVKETAALLRMT